MNKILCFGYDSIAINQALNDSTWAVLRRALRQETKGGIDFRVKLPA